MHEDILNQYIVSTMIESINPLFATLWCSGRVPSPNDVIQKIEETRDNTRTKNQTRTNNSFRSTKKHPIILKPTS